MPGVESRTGFRDAQVQILLKVSMHQDNLRVLSETLWKHTYLWFFLSRPSVTCLPDCHCKPASLTLCPAPSHFFALVPKNLEHHDCFIFTPIYNIVLV